MIKKWRTKSWYPYAVALCIAVVLYVVLTHLPGLVDTFQSFGRFFNTVVIGCIVAYLMNPLAMLYERKLFKNLKKGSWAISVFLAFLTFIVAIAALIFVLVPQLVISIGSFVANAPEYQTTIHAMLEKLGATSLIDFPESTDEISEKIMALVKGYGEDIAAGMIGIAKGMINIVIGAVLAIYLLLAKASMKREVKNLLSAIFLDAKLNSILYFIRRCNFILNRYLVFTLLDALIVGGVNAIIMLVLRMPYVAMISIIAGITNLIPTFGPVIGAVIGGFILLLVNPAYAAMFIAITLVLQVVDGYIIKPKLFGNTLGVSGVLILLAIVIMGNAFGIGGILLAIPVAAICDFTYREGLLPYLRKRKARKQAEADAEAKAGAAAPTALFTEAAANAASDAAPVAASDAVPDAAANAAPETPLDPGDPS